MQSKFILIYPTENYGCEEILKYVVGLECAVYYDLDTYIPVWFPQQDDPDYRSRIIAINVDNETRSFLTLLGIKHGEVAYRIDSSAKDILHDKWQAKQ